MKKSYNPRDLKIGDKFRLRPATNSRIFKVRAVVLKICRENGFKNFHSEDHGKIFVPVEDYNSSNELILNPEKEIFIL